MTSDDGREDGAVKPKGERSDPLEDPTQAMSANERQRASGTPSGVSDDSDTTTWGGAPAPNIAFDEEETLVSSSSLDSRVVDPDDTETLIAATPAEPLPSDSIAPSSSLRPMLLERIEPSLGRGERMRLDAAHWKVSLGRGEESDIRLYTASASRDHAMIAGSGNGDWILTPANDRSVMIDGEAVRDPIVLEIGMNIVLGQDHLRCVTEGLDRRAAVAATVAEGIKDSAGWGIGRLGKPILIAMALILVGFAAWAFSTLSGG